MDDQTNFNKVKLYACGGAGCNLAKTMEGFRNNDVSGFSGLDIVYVDTSGSDFDNISENYIYRFKDKDGSGGLRSENAKHVSKYIQEILQNHTPLDLNIVISSASGGSGSVLSALMCQELLKQNKNVIAILVGAVDTMLFINNTLNTLKSFEHISTSLNKSIVLKYLQNESSSKHKDVDDEVKLTIASLCMLFSSQNKGLDSKDLEHWINFDRVTTFKTQLASLETVPTLSEIKAQGNIISVCSLASIGGNTDLGQTVEVQYIGYVPEATPEESKEKLPIHFVTTDGIFEELGKMLNQKLAELKAQASARVQRQSLVSDEDEVSESGLIL